MCNPAAKTVLADRFKHPGAAFSVEPPTAWHAYASGNPQGYPFHIFSPENGSDVRTLHTGLWVFAVPIPTDQSLNASDLGVVVAQVLIADEPGLKAKQTSQPDTKLGTLKATFFEVDGTRGASGSWRGRMLVAVQQDSFLVVMYG